MGYNSIAVIKGSTTAIGVQFENVAVPEAGIPIKNIVSLDAPYGATSLNSNSDQIWVYTGSDWTKYYFYAANARKPEVGVWCLEKQTTEIPDTITLKPGQSFFFRRSDKANATLTLSGGVVPLADTKSYSLEKGSTTAMAWPWPEQLKIKDFSKYNSSPYGATSLNSNSDQIWVYTGSDWTKYYFYAANARKPEVGVWCLEKQTTEVGDDHVIGAGSAFFFRRSDKATAEISFVR